MRVKFVVSCLAFAACVACCSLSVSAQQPASAAPSQAQAATTEKRALLSEQAIALDALGREALGGLLLTGTLSGSNDAPVRNVRLVLQNKSADFYTYISGWATFYDSAGVRCGEGMFKVDALAPQESAETDTPGIRLTCSPMTWRIVALNLLTRTGDTARPILPQQEQPASTAAEQTTQSAPQPGATTQPEASNTTPLFVNVSVDGRAYRIPLGSTLEIPVNKKRTKITVSASPQ